MIVLPLDQQNDDYAGEKKWRQITNDDGTVSYIDETEYIQKGTAFGATESNKVNAAIMGFAACTTSFPSDKEVLEIDAWGKKKKTTFRDDGSIYEALYDENDAFLAAKTTTFKANGEITEEVQLA